MACGRHCVPSIRVIFGAIVGAEISDTVTAVNVVALERICDESTSKLTVDGAAPFAFGSLGMAAQN